MQRLLEAVEFRDPSRAREDIARLGGGIPERIRARIQSLLASVPDPDEALHFLERLRQDCPAAFNRIASSPAALRCLITTFSYSRFLSEAVLQHPEWLLQAADPGDLHRMLAAEEFAGRVVLPDLLSFIQQFRFRSRAAASRMVVAGSRSGRSAPYAGGRGIRRALAAIPRCRGLRSAGAGDPGALPAAAVATHPAARRAGDRRAGGHHRGAVQPSRRHPGFRLSPDSRATDGASWRAVV